MTVDILYTRITNFELFVQEQRGSNGKTNQKTERAMYTVKVLYMCEVLHVCGLTVGSSCGVFIHVCPLTIGDSCVPGIMALASCICWASMAMFFCWMRLFLPLISSWVFRWGGGCRYLQFSLEQRP